MPRRSPTPTSGPPPCNMSGRSVVSGRRPGIIPTRSPARWTTSRPRPRSCSTSWRCVQSGSRPGRGWTMRLILNVIWLVLCGWWMAIAYFLAGIIAFVLIITFPFGIAAWRIAGYVLWPFGRSVVARQDFGVGATIGNILWIVLIGWWLALGHLTSGIMLCLTIIGIPLGLANFKLIPISLLPLGVQIVNSDELYPGYAPRHSGGTYA